MLISLDRSKCRRCGVCIVAMGGYCIEGVDGMPSFDAELCNTCQKCVALCPHQAILVAGAAPDKIVDRSLPDPALVRGMLERRRSAKRFLDKPIPRDILDAIIETANYSPNQNKNLSLHVFDDARSMARLERCAIGFVRRMHALLFGFRPLTALLSLFVRDLSVIEKKMGFGGFKKALYENTQVVLVVSGRKSTPVTESSAHYMLATMAFMAESLGVQSCLMDTVYLSLRLDPAARRELGIEEDVLGALILGYSAERIVNIPRGYEVPTKRNAQAAATVPTSKDPASKVD